MITLATLALKTGPVRLRQWAAQKLGASHSPHAVGPLSRLLSLNNTSPELRQTAVRALGEIGPASVGPLLNIVRSQSRHSEVYRLSLQTVVMIGEPAVNCLIDSLNDSLMTEFAAAALGEIRAERSVDALVTVVRDRPHFGRCFAIGALSKIGNRQAVPCLIQVLIDPDAGEDRLVAAHALGEIGDVSTLETLVGIVLGADNQRLQAQSIVSLGRIGSPLAAPALSSILSTSEQSQLRVSAAEALSNIQDDVSVSALLDAVFDNDRMVRVAAIKALGRRKTQRAVSHLISVIREQVDDSTVRVEAALSLERIADPSAVGPLKEVRSMLKEPHEEVIHHPEGISDYYGYNQTYYPAWDEIIRDDPDGSLREAIDHALFQLRAGS